MPHLRATLTIVVVCLALMGCAGSRAKPAPAGVTIYPTATPVGGVPTSPPAPSVPTVAAVPAVATTAATNPTPTATPRVIVVTATPAPKAEAPTATTEPPTPTATTAPPPPPSATPTHTPAPSATPTSRPPTPTFTATPKPIPLEQRRFVVEFVKTEKTNDLLSKIQGTVVDKNGKGIPNVVVELKDVAINGQITNADGWFLFQHLSNNTYKVNLRNFTNCEPAIVTTDTFQLMTVRLREVN